MFPLNCWYVGGLSAELSAEPSGARPLGRTLLGQKLVLFRDAEGRVNALEDRCPHRGLPLSMGCVENGNLRCGYHGLLIDARGHCIEIPGQQQIPVRSALRRYATEEHDGVIWVWFGREAASQPDHAPPRWSVMSDPVYRMRGEAFHYDAPWQLIHDNLMDLTHAGYVHAQTIGGNPRMHSEAPTQLSADGEVVRVQRRLLNSPPPATFTDAWPFNERIDRWQQIEFHVSHVRIFAGGSDAGTDDIESRLPEERAGLRLPSFHAVTPETDKTSHYIWMVGCNSPREGALERTYQQFHATFVEDKVVIEAQYKNLQHFGDVERLSAHFDRAPTMARRVVDRLASAC
jgi:vanillate O-demethylase monooxygenase subunit